MLLPRVLVAFQMGCFGSKEKLSKEDLEFLKTHTRYDESMIKEWYRGFRVSLWVLHLLPGINEIMMNMAVQINEIMMNMGLTINEIMMNMVVI